MAGIKKACLKSYFIQIVICVQQIILRLIQSDICNIFPTGTPVSLPEKLCKIGVTHMANICQLLNLQRLTGMRINIISQEIRHTNIVAMADFPHILFLNCPFSKSHIFLLFSVFPDHLFHPYHIVPFAELISALVTLILAFISKFVLLCISKAAKMR